MSSNGNYIQGIESSDQYNLLISGGNNQRGGIYLGGSYNDDGTNVTMQSYQTHMYTNNNGFTIDISGKEGFYLNNNNGVTPLFALNGMSGALQLPTYGYGKNSTDGPDTTMGNVPLTVDESGNVVRDVGLYNMVQNLSQQIETIDNQLLTLNLDEITKYNTEISTQLATQGNAINSIVSFVNKLNFARNQLGTVPIVHNSPGSSSPIQTGTVQSSPPNAVTFSKITPFGQLTNGLQPNKVYYLGNYTNMTLTGNISVQTSDGEWTKTFFNLAPYQSGSSNYTALNMPTSSLYEANPLMVVQYSNGTTKIQYTMHVKPDNSGYEVIMGSGPLTYITDFYLGLP